MKRIVLIILLIVTCGTVTAQQPSGAESIEKKNISTLNGWNLRVCAGINIGGTAPLPLPREIRSINSYSPSFNMLLEGNVQKCFDNSRWGTQLGIRIESKGMKSDADTKNYYMEAWNTDGSGKVVGAWTGKVETKVSSICLTFPVLATYNASERITLSAGPYVSYLIDGEFSGEAYDGYIRDQNPTGERADITRALYDFSGDINKWQWGVQAGCEYKAYSHLALFANLQWGLSGLFPSDYSCVTFALYPIYGTLGVTYLF